MYWTWDLRMLATDRRTRLLELVQQQGFASLPDLAAVLRVSESTIRRDLAHLEKQGETKRTHGGAFYSGPSPQLAHFQNRQEAQWDEKKTIAHTAASMINDGDTLLLDGGSTTYELAQLLANRPIQVVTNSLPVANLFSASADVELVVIGGYVLPRSGAIHGPYADEMLQSLRVHKAVLSAAGVDSTGIYNSNHMLASTQRAMVDASDEVILLADSSKFGRRSLACICELDQIDHVVADQKLDPTWQKQLTELDVKLVLAPLETPLKTPLDAQPIATN